MFCIFIYTMYYNDVVNEWNLTKEVITMETRTFKVPNIGCDGCVRAIENEISTIEGVQSVKAEVASKQVVVAWDRPASWDAIKDTLVEIEYPPEG
jgi:copper chaperone